MIISYNQLIAIKDGYEVQNKILFIVLQSYQFPGVCYQGFFNAKRFK